MWGVNRGRGIPGWWGDSAALLRFYSYSKMRDHKFPASAAVLKLLHLGEKQERRWTERRPTGFAAVQETSQRMLQERYAPYTDPYTKS